MSSSLDDREPYEFFQDELDAMLEDYKKYRPLSSMHLHFVNAFIEYVCSCKFCRSKEEIFKQEIKDEFIEYIEIGFNNIYSKEELTKAIENYLNFINS